MNSLIPNAVVENCAYAFDYRHIGRKATVNLVCILFRNGYLYQKKQLTKEHTLKRTDLPNSNHQVLRILLIHASPLKAHFGYTSRNGNALVRASAQRTGISDINAVIYSTF